MYMHPEWPLCGTQGLERGHLSKTLKDNISVTLQGKCHTLYLLISFLLCLVPSYQNISTQQNTHPSRIL